MGFSILGRLFGAALALSTLLVAGCGTFDPRLSEDKWILPKRDNAESAMIIGRIAMPENKEENPKDLELLLFDAVFVKEGGGYICGGVPCGEKSYAMYNNYFVVPNLKPGVKYHFQGFVTNRIWNGLPVDYNKPIVLKPGQILFIGSYDYLDGPSKFFGPGSFNIRPNKKPTELEALQWVYTRSGGSGWESTISNRIKALSGNIVAQQPAVPATKK